MGIRGGANGFYQRRATGDKPFWPEASKEDSPNSPTRTPLKLTPPLLTQAVVAEPGTSAKKAESASATTVTTTCRISTLKKNSKRKKKHSSRRSSSTFLEDDDALVFGTKKPRKETKPSASALFSSLTPRNGPSSSSQERAQLPLVTPAAPCTYSAAGVVQTQPRTLPAAAAVSAAIPKPCVLRKLKQQSPPKIAAATSTRGPEPWHSPHPHSQESSSLEQTADSSIPLPCQEEEIQALKDNYRREMQEQQRKHDMELREWKKKCQEQDTTIKSLQREFAIHKETSKKEHVQALEEAVQQERIRITNQWEQEKKRVQHQLDSLQQQLGKSNSQLESLEYAKFQELGGHHLRMQMMAKSLIEMSTGHREAQAENQRQKLQLQVTQNALAEGKGLMRALVSAQNIKRTPLADGKRLFCNGNKLC